MVEKREVRRRRYIPDTRFPLYSYNGDLIKSERRLLPTRRINDIKVEEISYMEFVSRLR